VDTKPSFDAKASIVVAKDVVEVADLKPVADPRFSGDATVAFVPLPSTCAELAQELADAWLEWSSTQVDIEILEAELAEADADLVTMQAFKDSINMYNPLWQQTLDRIAELNTIIADLEDAINTLELSLDAKMENIGDAYDALIAQSCTGSYATPCFHLNQMKTAQEGVAATALAALNSANVALADAQAARVSHVATRDLYPTYHYMWYFWNLAVLGDDADITFNQNLVNSNTAAYNQALLDLSKIERAIEDAGC